MRKRLSLLACVLAFAMSFAGCGSKSKELTYDEQALAQSAETIIATFQAWDEEVFDNFKEGTELEVDMTLLQSGLPVQSEAFIGMIDAWNGALKECGEFWGIGEFTAEQKTDGVVLSAEAQYEDRDATIEFKFDEKLQMESMDVSAHYTTSEILAKAGMNTVLGMGTVFAVLIFLAFLISLMKYIPMLLEKFKKKEVKTSASETTKQTVSETVAATECDDLELVAVITAAIAASEGTSTDGFVVRSIRRRTSNKWN